MKKHYVLMVTAFFGKTRGGSKLVLVEATDEKSAYLEASKQVSRVLEKSNELTHFELDLPINLSEPSIFTVVDQLDNNKKLVPFDFPNLNLAIDAGYHKCTMSGFYAWTIYEKTAEKFSEVECDNLTLTKYIYNGKEITETKIELN